MIQTDPVLLPYQIKWQLDESRVRIAEKSRRVGFSWNIAAECGLEAAEIAGCDAWYVGYNKDMSQEFIRDVAFFAKCFALACSGIEEEEIFEEGREDKGILTYTIRFASGFRVSALSSRPTNLRAKRGHIVIDEAAHHDDLKGLIKAAMAVLMWGGRARVDILSTHNGVANYFNTILEEVKAGKRPYSLHRVTLDDALAQGLYERICLVNNETPTAKGKAAWRKELFAEYGDDALEELLCVPSSSGGVYITRNLIERQMLDGPVYRLALPDGFVTQPENERKAYVEEWCEGLQASIDALPKDRLHFFGEDFGRSSDRTVITPGYLTQDLRRRFPSAIELHNVPYEQQKQVLFFVVDQLPKFFAGALDATGNGEFLAEAAMQRYGQRVACIKLTDPWYALNLPPFKAAFEDEMISVVRDADHMTDLGAFRVINGIPKLPKIKTVSANVKAPKRHADAAIAYLLGYFASRMPVTAYTGYIPTKTDKTKKGGFTKRRGGLL